MKFAAFLLVSILCVGYISAENSWKVIGTEAEFNEHIKNAGEQLVVLEFFGTWCAPCKAIAPLLEKLAPNYPNVVLLKADIDKSPELATKLSVAALPTFIFFKSGEKVDRFVGANVKQLESTIARLSENPK